MPLITAGPERQTHSNLKAIGFGCASKVPIQFSPCVFL